MPTTYADLASAPMSASISLNVTAGGSPTNNIIIASIQLLDALGKNVASRRAVKAYLSNDANGDSVESASGNLSVAAGTNGALVEISTDNGFLLISEADGTIDVSITENSSNNTMYLVLVMPLGNLVVSPAIAFPV